jgi:hypothetical protein
MNPKQSPSRRGNNKHKRPTERKHFIIEIPGTKSREEEEFIKEII